MTPSELKKSITSLVSDIEFEYNGKFGSICPFNLKDISLSYNDTVKDFTNVDDLMSDSFFDGKSLNEISHLINF